MALIFFAAIATLCRIAVAVSPSPVKCDALGCSLRNYLGVWPDRIPCRAAQVFYPATEEELLAAVAYAASNNRKMKMVSRWSQSIPKLACPGGDSGVIISTRDLNSGIVVNSEEMTVTVDAGVLLQQLVDTISTLGFALPAATYWNAVSVAGAVSTGAHGSSLWGRGGALHDYVVGVSLVVPATEEDGFAKVVRLDENSSKDLLDAAKLSLGVLGAISKITLSIEPMFKRSVALEVKDDAEIEEQVLRFGSDHEFGDICWHPSLKASLFKLDERAPLETPGGGTNIYKGFQPFPVERAEQSRRKEKIEQDKDEWTRCRFSEMVLNSRVPSGNGYLNDGINFTGFPVVGYNNLMQTAGGCQDAPPQEVDSDVCSWDPRVAGSFYHQTAFSVSLDKVKDLILDIKKLRDMDPSSLCGLSLYGGIYLRYVKASSAYLGQKEDAVEFDITYYRSRDGGTPRLNEDVVEEIEQMALFKYQGKPHWGKNRNIAFTSIRDRVKDLDRFAWAKSRLDPAGLFSSEWSDAILGGDRDGIVSFHDHCALEGMCICSEDRHCAPESGFFCRPGKVFVSARVCRYEGEEKAGGGVKPIYS
ncbi:hypothetical protein SELMODRAFT_181802 [Selaginella moellendorffii]|uniref:L-gulonolactone oxidase n=1 Tax=Selaginella moellendorffii TaxID=88036 RepID=D8SQD4_SELML|nr:hypothetical protein SELMODRAFT_181802 [Selaginella moellendorffii]